jgi:glycosyltransferase involved in cell wall biosynthesis
MACATNNGEQGGPVMMGNARHDGEIAITVAIPVRNGARTIGAQLDALEGLQDPGVHWEVVVADNASTDGTAAIVAAHPLSGRVPMRVVQTSPTAGINVARNAAIAAARGRLIVLCDADDVVRPNWLSAYSASMLDGPPSTAAGPLDVSRVNNPRWAAWGVPLAEPHRFGGRLICGWGANMALHRDVWVSLGGFDESYPYGFDEVDFFARASDVNVPFTWVHDAVVDYWVQPGVLVNVRKGFRQGVASARFCRDHPTALPLPTITISAKMVVASLYGALRAWPPWNGQGEKWRMIAYHSGQFVGALRTANNQR